MNNALVRTERLVAGMTSLTLQRADKRNALNVALLTQLGDSIENLSRDTRCRVVVLRGDGPVFCAGLDLTEAAQPATAEASAEQIRRCLELMRQSPLIFIGAAQGAAMAGGAGLLAACDLVVAADDLRIGFPEVRRGLVAAIVSKVVAARVREGDLRELFLLAEPINAERARQMGLVQWIVPAEKLHDRALAMGMAILAGGPEAVRQTKWLINQRPATVELETLQLLHERIRHSDEAREGLAAFKGKREPNWCDHS